ncbi:serine hydrolase [Bifidobacterium saguinibicoloris]|uniref:serine hydrolase n=1 Tax=Bifidobacterium saguinibicoloris TaxID=2834433 RepID=UPI001C58C4F4|nr:serine hydrolase [Bifidobacterium saguinibicoloris]MBW3081139.1 serine hydrolase [Bifidobacterium saguinibicoloris]
MWTVITAIVAAVALVAALVFAFTVGRDFFTGATPPTSSASSDTGTSSGNGTTGSKTKKKTKTNTKSKATAKPDAKSLSSITSKYSSTDVSVSAMFLGDGTSSTTGADYSADDIANTAAARTKFVSAGLYLPVYVAARSNGGDAFAEAQSMMSTMSNDDANQAIADLGGFDAVNQWLSSHGYDDTTLGRNYGDVAASDAGYENYSSTYDAVRMLAAVDADGASDLMNVDVASEGVAIPTDMTVHAHRGQGIKNTWNYFAVVTTPHGKAAVALATQNQGKETAAKIMGEVLADIDSQLAKADE